MHGTQKAHDESEMTPPLDAPSRESDVHAATRHTFTQHCNYMSHALSTIATTLLPVAYTVKERQGYGYNDSKLEL